MNSRLYYLDNLRAVIMLQAVLVHSMLFLTPITFFAIWPVHNHPSSTVYTFFSLLIFITNMPLFFILAGYFSKKIYHKYGIKYFIKHRWQRIVCPFLIAMVLLNLYHTSFFMTYLSEGGEITPTVIFDIYGWTSYLWFLYYLILFYIAILLLQSIWNYGILKQQWIENTWVRFTQMPGHVLLLAVPSILVARINQHLTIHPPLNIIPHFIPFLHYFVYFAFGWLMHNAKQGFEGYCKWGWLYCLFALIIVYPICFYAYFHQALTQQHPLFSYLPIILGPLYSWLLSCGLLGVFKRFLNHFNRGLSYFARVSYCFYFMQVPLIIMLQLYFSVVSLPIFLKLFYVYVIALLIMMLSYELFVRKTWIGKMLNGKVPKTVAIVERRSSQWR